LRYENSATTITSVDATQNRIYINDIGQRVLDLPVLFLPGHGPAFIPIKIPDAQPTDVVKWSIFDQTLHVALGDLAVCPPVALLSYAIVIPDALPRREQFIAAEALIAENLAAIIPEADDINVVVRITRTDVKKRQATGNVYYVVVSITGTDPLHHATQFILGVRYYATISLARSMEGIGATQTADQGGLRQIPVDDSTTIPPSASETAPSGGGLVPWEAGLVSLGALSLVVLIVLVVLLVRRAQGHNYSRLG